MSSGIGTTYKQNGCHFVALLTLYLLMFVANRIELSSLEFNFHYRGTLDTASILFFVGLASFLILLHAPLMSKWLCLVTIHWESYPCALCLVCQYKVIRSFHLVIGAESENNAIDAFTIDV